ncbi:hypothetical protein BD410DRAFT_735326, partial [Rickenella mellea]
ALELHLNILWGVVSVTNPPPQPHPTTISYFNASLNGVQGIHGIAKLVGQASITPHVMATVANLKSDVLKAKVKSNLARDISRVLEAHIVEMFRGVSGLGLEVWQPDFTGSPDSIYNSAHELVALQSFRTVLTTGGYNFLQPDLRFATDAHLHRKLYRHIIFSYQRKRLELESREAGGLAERNKMTNVYARRLKVCGYLMMLEILLKRPVSRPRQEGNS